LDRDIHKIFLQNLLPAAYVPIIDLDRQEILDLQNQLYHSENFYVAILFVLFLALCYTTVPGAHILLVPEIETEAFVFTEDEEIGEELYAITEDDSMITHLPVYRDSFENHSFIVSKRAMNSTLEWSLELQAFPGVPNQFAISEGEYGYTINNDKWIWTLDKDSGEILSKYACFDLENWDGNITNSTEIIAIGPCISALEVIENPDAEVGQSKGALYITTAKNTVVRSEIFTDSYVETNQTDKLSGVSEIEEETLEFVDNKIDGLSRLSCQIEITEELDGMSFQVPID